jgi:hypothetical protein
VRAEGAPGWITIAEAATLMGLGKRGASKRLVALNRRLEGRLLRKIGDKVMPHGKQASKYLVSVDVLRHAVLESDAERERDDLRAELTEVSAKLEALRRSVRPLLRQANKQAVHGTGTSGH